VSEGWILEVRGMIGAGNYSTRDVDLYQPETESISQEVENDIPF
jgi:hypothetical protein